MAPPCGSPASRWPCRSVTPSPGSSALMVSLSSSGGVGAVRSLPLNGALLGVSLADDPCGLLLSCSVTADYLLTAYWTAYWPLPGVPLSVGPPVGCPLVSLGCWVPARPGELWSGSRRRVAPSSGAPLPVGGALGPA